MGLEPYEAIAALEKRAERVSTPAGDGQIVWRIWGDGPVLILLHGGHGSWLHWIRSIPELSGRYRLVVPDLPGMGDSDTVGDESGIEPIAEMLVSGIDILGIGDRYSLAGFSFGSLVAGHMLRHHHARITHLLTIGSAGFGRYDPIADKLRRWWVKHDPAERRAVHRHNLSVLMLHDPAKVDDLGLHIQADGAERMRTRIKTAAQAADLRKCLEQNPVPLTGIWGENDVLVRNHMDERRTAFAQLRPSGQLFLVHGAGHWVQYEDAEATNALFIQSLEA